MLCASIARDDRRRLDAPRAHLQIANAHILLHHSCDVIDTATPLVLAQIEKQPLRPFGVGSPAYHIADYGTADAGTSLGLVTKMVGAVRARAGEEKEVAIHYEDQLT